MFGFLKDKLKKTVEKFTKEVDAATKKVEPTEEQKKEILEEIKQEEQKKGFFSRLKDTFTAVEEKPIVDIKHRVEEGEKEIESLFEKKKAEKQEKEHKEKKERELKQTSQEKKEEKGFFARLKDKLVRKEEEVKKQEEPSFEVKDAEVSAFEEAFKEVEEVKKEKEIKKEEDEIVPVVTETEKGETVFELQKKPSAVSKKKEKIPVPLKEKKSKEPLEEEGTGIFSALKDTIFKTSLSQEKFEELFWDLEVILLENNVAVEVIELIKENLKKDLVEKKILRGKINEIILSSLRTSIDQAFSVEPVNIIEKIKEKKPFIIVFVGINGSGKTTTIAKVAHKLKQQGVSCVIAAGDTFRAAAIQQLEEHANNLNIKMIKHNYGSDPAAVGFDAIKYAEAHHVDCVLIDTAGRLHSNTNLMDEMKKIIRVTKPDLKLFIGEAITGNDCVEQAREFHTAIGIDGIILAKADIDEKGGAALSVSYVTGKPILYLGSGQGYDDLEVFDKEKVIGQLGLA